MLTSLLVSNVVTTVNSVITSAFSGILLNFFYYNCSNYYVIKCKLYSVKNWMNDLIVNVALKPLYIHKEGRGNNT